MSRYVLHLVDTIKIDHEKAILLTDGVKSTKETLFFLTPESDGEVRQAKPDRSAKRAANGNTSPLKNKTVAGKILRNKTRSAAQEEVMLTAATKLMEHQKELHTQLQIDGLNKYSEVGGGGGGKEGKSWKRFQSYKGEAGLPKEAEGMRVSIFYDEFSWSLLNAVARSTLTAKLKASFCRFTDSLYLFISIL